MYSCKICGKTFEKPDYKFRRHLKNKHNLRKYDYAMKYEPEWIEKGLTQNQLAGGLTVAEKREMKLKSGEIEFVECKICGKLFQSLRNHTKKAHGVTIKEYKERYPGAPIISEELSKRQSEVAHSNKEKFIAMTKNNWDNPEYREKMCKLASENLSKRNRENWKDEDYRKRMSEKQKRVIANQLKNEEFRKMLAENGRKSWAGKSYEETKERREQARALGKAQAKRLWNDEEWVKAHMKLFDKLLREGKMAYKPAVINIELNGKEYVFKSSYELAFALYLVDNNIEFLYEPVSVGYHYDGRDRFYTPDFYIPEEDTFYEVKGYVRNKERLKAQIEALEKEFGKKVVLATDEVLNSMFDFKEYRKRARELYKAKDKRE